MDTDDSNATMAVFLDLENIALGAQEAHYPAFDIKKVVERLLLKGHIVVKKAYCDFDRYKDFKRGLHEAAFELIEIPHLRQSGKNSAGHVDTFVIISGDSDFSPLVSKLRENAKTVIGVGVKKSSSDLFINNCDQFIYYDDLVRAITSKARARGASAASEAKPVESKGLTVAKAIELVVETLEAITEEREEDDNIWGSMIKQAIKRRNPGFNERAFGFRSFNDLLLEGQKRGQLKLEADEKSGGYRVRLGGQ
jgi:hypothetical protein